MSHDLDIIYCLSYINHTECIFTSVRERPTRGEGEFIGVIPKRLEAMRHRVVRLVDRHQLRLVAAVLDEGILS